MKQDQGKKKKQDLGIFYTPKEVVNFIFQILKIWKDKEDKQTKRWQSKKPRPHYPSVIDPACGEGVFLKSAITTGFTGEDPRFKAPYVWGIDLDKSVVDRWEQISLLSLFYGDKVKMNNHFYHQNGLLPLKEKNLMYKNANEGLRVFDAVVGNPPYGGIGLESITPDLESALFEYSLWKLSVRKNTTIESDQLGLLERQVIDIKEKDRIIKFPIEILFLDRFIQLAKPGGWIAIVIPDGILTNSNSHYVREFLANRTKVEAIISLPRETFKNMGTSAKTSILFLRKMKNKEKPEQNYKVFLASIERINQNNFDTIVKYYKKLYN